MRSNVGISLLFHIHFLGLMRWSPIFAKNVDPSKNPSLPLRFDLRAIDFNSSMKDINRENLSQLADGFTGFANQWRKAKLSSGTRVLANKEKWSEPFNGSMKRIEQGMPTGTFEGSEKSGDQEGRLKLTKDMPSKRITCPVKCNCKYGPGKQVVVVDCSNRGLTEIPQLPFTSREVYLQNNSISEVACTSFEYLKYLRKLDLSWNPITNLSMCSLSGVYALEHLRLSHCEFANLPVGVFDSLHNLRHLNLSENSISNIDQRLFTHVNNIKSLDLSYNNLTKLLNGTFQTLSSLGILSLKQNRLLYQNDTFEDRAFMGLVSLEDLHLEGNQPNFTTKFNYPDQALARVPTIRRLWLDGYPRALGPGFSSLLQLSYLSFSSGDGGFCSMQSNIPSDFFSHLTSKQSLHINMSKCGIAAMSPLILKSLSTIHTLDLASNQALSIDGFEKASFGLQNSTISVLNISDISYPFALYTLIRNTTFQYLKHTSLKVLVVENCSIGNVDPQAVLDLPQSLEYVSFQGNYIWKAFALYSMIHLRNLKVAKISNQLDYHREKNDSLNWIPKGTRYSEIMNPNTVKETFPFFGTFTSFNNLDDISHNESKSFCRGLGKGTGRIVLPLPMKLEELYAGDTKLAYNIPITFMINNRVIKFADYSSNNIRCFGGPIYGAPLLEHFDLSRNFCFRINPLFFSHMPNVKTLLLQNNRLGRSLASDSEGLIFSKLTLMKTLNLSSNVIDSLSEVAFQKNENLQILDLSDNVLRQFRTSLTNNTKLKSLNLSSNYLEGLTEATCLDLLKIKRNSPKFTVRIEDNNFQCVCNELYFLRFLLDEPGIFEDVTTFSCQLANGSSVGYANLPLLLPHISLQCAAQSIFIGVLVAFFLVSGALVVSAIYHYNRWQWKYLYYVGRSRLHIGSTHITYRPVANVLVTYDQVRKIFNFYSKT